MFTQDLDSTASYRALARGFGCGFARAYQASQRACAASSAPGRMPPPRERCQSITPERIEPGVLWR